MSERKCSGCGGTVDPREPLYFVRREGLIGYSFHCPGDPPVDVSDPKILVIAANQHCFQLGLSRYVRDRAIVHTSN